MSELFLARSQNPPVLADLSTSVARELGGTAPWLTIRTVYAPHCSTLIIAGVNRQTPLGLYETPAGVSLVMGYGREETPQHSAAALQAEHAAAGYWDAGSRLCRELEFGVAASSLADAGLVLTTDFLGLFPIYVYHSAALTICTSQLSLIRFAPGFAAEIDTECLIGGLLFSHNLLGQTMWRNVKRLDARQVLSMGTGGEITYRSCPHPNPAVRAGGIDEHVEACHSTLQGIVDGHLTRGVRTTLMSGGLDSRMIAGYVQNCAEPQRRGFVIGDPSDNDVRCGTGVLRAIGFTPDRIGIDFGHYPDWALREAGSIGGESGLYCTHFWALEKGLEQCDTPVFTGLLGDAVMGANHARWAYDPSCGDYSWDTLLSTLSGWGLPIRVVERLFARGEARDIGIGLYRRLGDLFESYSGEGWCKAWWFDLHHRQRFVVGRVAKIIAATNWPVMPLTNYRLIELLASFPISTLDRRRLQFELVMSRFPQLAALPLDRLGVRFPSVRASLERKVGLAAFLNDNAERIIGGVRRRLHFADRRFHARMLTLNSEGWRQVRDLARAKVGAADEIINGAEALKLIPPGEERVPAGANETQVAAGRGYLMGFLLWMAMR